MFENRNKASMAGGKLFEGVAGDRFRDRMRPDPTGYCWPWQRVGLFILKAL